MVLYRRVYQILYSKLQYDTEQYSTLWVIIYIRNPTHPATPPPAKTVGRPKPIEISLIPLLGTPLVRPSSKCGDWPEDIIVSRDEQTDDTDDDNVENDDKDDTLSFNLWHIPFYINNMFINISRLSCRDKIFKSWLHNLQVSFLYNHNFKI